MPKIVISYRRSDTAGVSGRIYDRLLARYGDEFVFMDVVNNKPGVDFRRQIANALRRCDLMIAVIGQEWRGAVENGRARVMDEEDFIHIELQTALGYDIPIIPVLVDDAKMPGPDDIPKDIRQFCYAQAAEVDVGRNFKRDIEALIASINELLEAHGHDVPAAPQPQQTPQMSVREAAATVVPVSFGQIPSPSADARPGKSWRWRVGLAAAVVLLLGGSGIVYQSIKGGMFFPMSERPVLVPGPVPLPLPKQPDPIGGPTKTASVTSTAQNLASELRSVVFSHDGRWMAVAGEDGFVRVWDAETFILQRPVINVRSLLPKPRALGEPYVHRIAFSMEDDLIYSVGLDNSVAVIDRVTGQLRSRLESEPKSEVSLFHSISVFPRNRFDEPDKFWVAAGGDDGCYRIWHVQKPELRRWRYANGERLYSDCDIPAKRDPNVELRSIIAYSHRGRDLYAIGNQDGNIGIVFNEFRRVVVRGHKGPVADLIFSPDSKKIATASGDGTVRVWDVSDNSKSVADLSNPIAEFRHDQPASSVAWSYDGQNIVSGGHDSLVRVWNVANNRPARSPLKGHDKDIQSVAFHPKRSWIASASQDGSLKIWDDKSPEALLTLMAFRDGHHLVYHRNGTYTGSPGVEAYVRVTYEENGMPRHLFGPDTKSFFIPAADFGARLRSTM